MYLGTAAAEGIPAIFCGCDNCKKSRAIGGRALRSRSQAIIDGKLLIDFNADTLWHFHRFGIDPCGVSACIVTHSHSDHLYAPELDMLRAGYSNMPEGYKFEMYGSDKVGEKVSEYVAKCGKLASFTEVKPFESFKAAGYEITALPAIHDVNAGPLFYIISDGEKKVLYAHDTHFFADSVWEFFAKTKPRFDLVSLDCTNACTPMGYVGHMSIAENKTIRERFLKEGYADANTRFVSNHFSHNGENSVYDDYLVPAMKAGLEVSYDGMQIEL